MISSDLSSGEPPVLRYRVREHAGVARLCRECDLEGLGGLPASALDGERDVDGRPVFADAVVLHDCAHRDDVCA